MKEKNKLPQKKSARRNFLKMGFLAGGAVVTGVGLTAMVGDDNPTGEKVKVMTTDGKTVEVDSNKMAKDDCCNSVVVSNEEAREGMHGKKFVMVIDLSKCRNALKCQDSCNKHHYVTGHNAWLKVYNMQESKDTAPYWMPMTCQHCDKPACVTVCPVDATFKRRDGIVLVDNERCIGCRFCMAACPYSARVFNWEEPDQREAMIHADHDPEDSPEHAGHRSIKGTIDKCDFCPHSTRLGKLPHCVTSCPNDVFLFGDAYEDTVTNGSGQSYRLTKLLEDKAGYRYMDGLGTEPSVFYLPPTDRSDDFNDGLKNYDEFKSVRKSV